MKTEPSESVERGDQGQGSTWSDPRAPYEAPRLTREGSFRELTRGGGLTGQDIGVPFGQRPGAG